MSREDINEFDPTKYGYGKELEQFAITRREDIAEEDRDCLRRISSLEDAVFFTFRDKE